MPGPRARVLAVPPNLRAELVALERSRTAPVRLVERAGIVRRAADGVANAVIARELGLSEDTVRKWRGRFSVDAGVNSLVDNERSGRPAVFKPEHRAVLTAIFMSVGS